MISGWVGSVWPLTYKVNGFGKVKKPEGCESMLLCTIWCQYFIIKDIKKIFQDQQFAEFRTEDKPKIENIFIINE